MNTRHFRHGNNLLVLAFIAALAGCASTPETEVPHPKAKLVCDSYIILDMCVEDIVGDSTVDIVYFSDTHEIFMYQQGRRDEAATAMPFHRCAVSLSPDMQATTNRILDRANLSLLEEADISRNLLKNYMAAKPEIDACNARFENEDADNEEPQEEFFMGDADYDDY